MPCTQHGSHFFPMESIHQATKKMPTRNMVPFHLSSSVGIPLVIFGILLTEATMFLLFLLLSEFCGSHILLPHIQKNWLTKLAILVKENCAPTWESFAAT